MSITWRDFLYTFIPIFVAMDVAGLIPLYLTLTKGLSEEQKRFVDLQALVTAFIISVAFIAVGRWIFTVLGISVADFEIAGGILLLVLAVSDLLGSGAREGPPNMHVGPVPLGIPIIVGPAVLTSLLVLIPLRGYGVTLIALLINLLLVWVAFLQSPRLVKWFGDDGLRATSKVILLFLAAIGVSMVRRGVQLLR
jgi:multiple antibiotic resistance protein